MSVDEGFSGQGRERMQLFYVKRFKSDVTGEAGGLVKTLGLGIVRVMARAVPSVGFQDDSSGEEKDTTTSDVSTTSDNFIGTGIFTLADTFTAINPNNGEETPTRTAADSFPTFDGPAVDQDATTGFQFAPTASASPSDPESVVGCVSKSGALMVEVGRDSTRLLSCTVLDKNEIPHIATLIEPNRHDLWGWKLAPVPGRMVALEEAPFAVCSLIFVD